MKDCCKQDQICSLYRSGVQKEEEKKMKEKEKKRKKKKKIKEQGSLKNSLQFALG